MPEIFENGGMHEYQEAFDKARARQEEMSSTNEMLESWLRGSMIDFAIEHHAIKNEHPGAVYIGFEESDDPTRFVDIWIVPTTTTKE